MPQFTEEELAPLTDDTYEKVRIAMVSYRARIESQCLINEKHDELHQ